jgi:hypothetical protein
MAQPLCRASRGFPLAGPAALTARFTLLIFAIANLALIWIKNKDQPPPAGAFICPRWISFAGLLSSIVLLVVDLFV